MLLEEQRRSSEGGYCERSVGTHRVLIYGHFRSLSEFGQLASPFACFATATNVTCMTNCKMIRAERVLKMGSSQIAFLVTVGGRTEQGRNNSNHGHKMQSTGTHVLSSRSTLHVGLAT